MKYILLFLFPVLLNAQIVTVSGGGSSIPSRNNVVEQYDTYSALRADSNSLEVGNLFWLKTNDYSSPYIVKQTIDGLVNDSISCIKIANGKYGILQVKDVLKPEYFGAKADFRRDSVTCVATSATITCSTCGFTSSDVGKVVAIKYGRYYPQYREDPVAMNCKIISYISSTQVVLDSVIDYSGRRQMLWGTNNFDFLQKMFNYGNLKNVRNVEFGKGTYYIVPAKSTTMMAKLYGYRGMAIRNGFKIKGFGRNTTFLKYGEEDEMRVNESQIYNYAALYFIGDGDFEVSNLTLLSPDRPTTETACDHIYAMLTEFKVEIFQDINIHDVDVTGEWDQIFLSSRGGKWNSVKDSVEHWNNYRLKNFYYEAHCQGPSIFSEGPCKRLFLENVISGKSGAVQTSYWYNAATIRAGSDTIRIVNNPSFSFYDFISTFPQYTRKPRLTVGGTVGANTFDVVTIIDKTTAKLNTTSPVAYTADSLIRFCPNATAEYHATYIHPNVSNYWKDVKFYNCNAYGIHIFSSGHQAGKVEGYSFDNVVTYGPNKSTNANIILNNNINLQTFAKGGFIVIKNMLEQPWSASGSSKMKVYNSAVSINPTDTAEFYNCTGGVYLSGTNKLYKINSGNFTDIGIFGAGNSVQIDNTVTKYLEILQSCANSQEGFVWRGGGIGHLRLADLTNTKLTASGVFRFYNMGYAKGDYSEFVDYPSPTLSNSDLDLLISRFQFFNCTREWLTFSAQRTVPRGLFPVNEAVYPTTITGTFSPSSQKPNEYESWTKVYTPITYNQFKFLYSGSTAIQAIFPAGSHALTSGPDYRSYLQGVLILKGNQYIECLDTFRFTHGGLLRLQYSGPRNKYESVVFKHDPINGVLIETSNNDHTRLTTPYWVGINYERVYNGNPTGCMYWEYRLSTTQTSQNTVVSTPSSAIEYDLSNTPYLGFREKNFVDPSSYISITVPLQAGGNETFTCNEWGVLTGSNGSTGALRMTDGHVKLVLVANASGTIVTTYKYVSSQGWNSIGTK